MQRAGARLMPRLREGSSAKRSGRAWSRMVSVTLSAALLSMSVFAVPARVHALTVQDARSAGERVSAGDMHSLAIGPDGGVVAWGDDFYGQCDVPVGLDDVVAVAAGYTHSVALRSDGTLVAWGGEGELSYVPPDTDEAIAIAAGYDHTLVLNAGGTVTAAGSNNAAKCEVPPGLSDVIAVSAGFDHSLALKSDGTVVAWGSNASGQCAVPSGLENVVAIAAGGLHSLALKSDGTVVAWGRDAEEQCSVPATLADVIQVAAGLRHSLALKSDGSVVAWGGVLELFTDPSVVVPAALTDATAISAGGQHSLAVLPDGSFAGWGNNATGQTLGITSVNPAPWSTEIPVNLTLTISHSAPVQAGSTYDQITVKDSAGKQVAIDTSIVGPLLEIRSRGPLSNNRRYTVLVPASAVKDAWGNASRAVQFELSTPDTLPPVVVSANPPNDARGVSVDQALFVTFDEALKAGSAFGSIGLVDGQGAQVPCSVVIGSSGDRTLHVMPEKPLQLRDSYTLAIPANALQDARGNQFAGTSVSFTTGVLARRIAGADRIKTAVEISKDTFAEANTVIVATAMNYPDALAAAPLAHALQAPILLVPSGGVPAAVSAEITRVGAKQALIIGGPPAVSVSVENGLRTMGLSVKRVAGSDRYGTAVAIANELKIVRGVSGFEKAYVATGEGFSDALSAAGVAAAEGSPILLVRGASLPPITKNALSSLSVSRTVVLGGSSAVSGVVERQLPSPDRIAGTDRYSTGVRVAEYAIREHILSDSGVYVSTGMNYPDALAVGSATASSRHVLLLVSPNTIPGPVAGFLSTRKSSVSAIRIVGGTGAVSEPVAQALKGLVE